MAVPLRFKLPINVALAANNSSHLALSLSLLHTRKQVLVTINVRIYITSA